MTLKLGLTATRVGVATQRIPGRRDMRPCPRCGYRRQVRAGTDPLCSDCRAVDPKFGKKAS